MRRTWSQIVLGPAHAAVALSASGCTGAPAPAQTANTGAPSSPIESEQHAAAPAATDTPGRGVLNNYPGWCSDVETLAYEQISQARFETEEFGASASTEWPSCLLDVLGADDPDSLSSWDDTDIELHVQYRPYSVDDLRRVALGLDITTLAEQNLRDVGAEGWTAGAFWETEDQDWSVDPRGHDVHLGYGLALTDPDTTNHVLRCWAEDDDVRTNALGTSLSALGAPERARIRSVLEGHRNEIANWCGAVRDKFIAD